jgi:hypothetical protein
MKEIWHCYDRAEVPNGRYELIDLRRDGASVHIVVDNEIHEITVSFDVVIAFRMCDEGDRLKTIFEVAASKGDAFLPHSLICTVENSKFIDWLMDENYGVNDVLIKHYAVVTANDILDFLATNDPTIVIKYIS